MFEIPLMTKDLIDLAKSMKCSWIGLVPLQPKPFCTERNCHNNVVEYVNWYGGNRILGYYFLEDSGRFIAILHSIVRTWDDKLIDITPFNDGRQFNMFATLINQTPVYSIDAITSYKIGDAKMDVTESSFKGLSL